MGCDFYECNQHWKQVGGKIQESSPHKAHIAPTEVTFLRSYTITIAGLYSPIELPHLTQMRYSAFTVNYFCNKTTIPAYVPYCLSIQVIIVH